MCYFFFFFSSRRRHTRSYGDWSSDVCSSDLGMVLLAKRLGHEVTSVPGYDDARRQLAEPAARYDALIVDVHLDEAHSGFDLFEELRVEGRGRERRIVFTTGDSISTQTRDHLLRSERPVLRKPFSLDELREMLDRVAGD